MKRYLLLTLLSVAAIQSKSQDTITIKPLSGSFCAGSNLSASFTINGVYFLYSTYTVELSDTSGSFVHSTALNSYVTQSQGTFLSENIAITIPDTTHYGNHYRIRIVGPNLGDTSIDNGSNLIINPVPSAPVLTVNGNPCTSPYTLHVGGAQGAGQINWINTYLGSAFNFSAAVGGYVFAATVAGDSFGTAGYFPNLLDYPVGVFVDHNGYIYVADGNYRIQQYPPNSTANTNAVTVAGGNGAGSALNQITPTALFVDGNGNIYVADGANNRILKFPAGSTSATNGAIVAGGNGQGSNANQFNGITGIYLDQNSNLYVLDQGNSRVQRFPSGSTSATNGTTVAGGNGQGTAANQFYNPVALCLDSAANIYVADAGRIQKFPSGSTSATNGTTAAGGNGGHQDQYPIDDGFYNVSGLFVDKAGYIYVDDGGNNRILRFDPNSNSVNFGLCIAENIIGSNVTNYLSAPKGIYVDSNQNIYITDYNNSRIQKWIRGTPVTDYTTAVGPSYAASYIAMSGCTSKYSDTVYLGTAITPTVTIIGDTSICSSRADTFNVHNTNGGGTNPTFQWYNNNVSVGVYGMEYITNNVSDKDSIWVLMTSNNPCATQATNIMSNKLIISVDTAPYAHFLVQPSNTPHLWYIVNQSIGSSLTYSWNWGDNSSLSSGDTPSHIFDSAGYYNVCVTVTNASGCSDSYCDSNIYLFKDQSNQMVYLEVVESLPSGINTMNAGNIPEINYYAHALHFSESINIPTDMIMYDMSGRQILSKNNFTGNSIPLDKTISQGVYLIHLYNSDYIISKKLAIIQ